MSLPSSKKRLESWIEQDYGELPVSCTSLGTHRFPGSPAGLKEVEIFSFTMKDGDEHAGFVGPVVWSFWIKGMTSEPLEALAKGYLGWLIATMANDNKNLSIENVVGDRGIELFYNHLIGEGVDPGKLTVTQSTTYRLHDSEVYEFAFQAQKSGNTISMKTVLNGQDALSVMDNDPWYQLPQLYYFLGHIMPSTQPVTTTDAIDALPLASITLLMAKPLSSQSSELARALSVLGQVSIGGMIPGMPLETSESGCSGEIRWDDHQVRFMEIIAPAPGLDEMIQFTRMDNNALALLKNHVSHVLCFYQGEASDPVLRVQALFRLAAALIPKGLLGIIHTDAWQCFLPKALGPLADPARTKDMHEGLAHLALCNLIPFHTPKGTWWTSKGNHVFGIPDIALWDDGRFGVKPVQKIFSSLFSYLHGGAKIQPGHTMEFEGTTFVAGEVTEYHDQLCGPATTLALRPAKGGAPQRGGVATRRQANVPSAEGEQAASRIKGRFYGFVLGGIFIACAIGVPATHYTQMKLIMSGMGAVCLLYAFRPRGWL